MQTLWPLADHLGTARVILGAAGQVLSRLTYDSFGNLVNVPAIVPTFTFTGRDYDDASGLYNYRARWYDARNGIFVSNDPIGFAAGDTNLSRYVGNSPLQFTDPTGNLAFLAAIPLYCWVAGGLIAGGAATWGYASYSEANPNSSWAMQNPEAIKWVRGSGKVAVAIGMGMAMPFALGYLAAAYPTIAAGVSGVGLGLTGLEAHHLATTDKSEWTAGDYFENFAPLIAGAVSGFASRGRYFDGVKRGLARGAGTMAPASGSAVDARYGGADQRQFLLNAVRETGSLSEAKGVVHAFRQMRRLGFQLENVSLHYRGKQGVDLIFSRGGLFAAVEAKAGSWSISALRTYAGGLKQGSYGYNVSRLQRYLDYGNGQHDGFVNLLLNEAAAGRLGSYAAFYRSGTIYELPLGWPTVPAIQR